MGSTKEVNVWINSIVLFLFYINMAVFSQESSSDNKKMKIVCYFSSTGYYKSNFTPDMIDPFLCTHINYDFAILNELTYEINFGDEKIDIGQNFYQGVTALKNKNPDLKVILCLGGWEDSTKKYSDMVSDPSKRAHFVQTVVSFLKEHNFDGLDLAWEYPNCWQGNCGVNPDDVTNYVQLLMELKDAFASDSLILSASVSSVNSEVDAAYLVPNISKHLDHINLMSYDLHGGWETVTGHHSQFFPHPMDTVRSLNLNSSVNHWLYKGAEPSKLLIGIPAYGRSYTLRNPRANGLYAPVIGHGRPMPETKEAGIIAFHELCDDLGTWQYREDKRAGSYAVKHDQWVAFDSPRLGVSKARYARRRGLGGVVYKNLHMDDYRGTCFGTSFPILRSIHYGLYNEEVKDFETSEMDIKKFLEEIQLEILVEENSSKVDEEQRKHSAEEDDIILVLTETETTDSGQVITRELDVNAGTLQATGDHDGATLAKMQIAYRV